MKKSVSLSLKILFSAAILTFLFLKIPFKEIIQSLESANVLLIIFSLILILICNYLSAYETRYLIIAQNMSITTLEILKIHLATMYYGLFLPGGFAGGAVKWYKLSKYGSRSDAAAVVVVNRYLEIFMLLFTGVAYSTQIFIEKGFYELLFIWYIIVLLMLILFFLVLRTNSLRIIKRMVLHFPFTGKILNIIDKLFGSMQKYQRLSKTDTLKVFALLILYHSLGIFASYLLTSSLDLKLDFFDIAWIRSIIGILTLLPISFSGLGVREGSLVVLLSTYGISPGKSIAYSFLLFFSSVVISLLGGVIEMHGFLTRDKSSKERSEISS